MATPNGRTVAAPPPSWLESKAPSSGPSFLTSSPFAAGALANSSLYGAAPSGLLPGLGSSRGGLYGTAAGVGSVVYAPASQARSDKLATVPTAVEIAQGRAEELRCAPCDKDFVHVNQLVAHLKTHITCEVCHTYSASKKTVAAHKEKEHPTDKVEDKLAGVLSRPLETPEEIEAWRAERRKRWPTVDNVKQKEEELKRRIDSGEYVPSGRGRDRNDRKRGRKDQDGLSSKRQKNSPSKASATNAIAAAEPKSGLAALAAYGSSEEEEVEGDAPSSGAKATGGDANGVGDSVAPPTSGGRSRQPCKFYRRGFCKNGARCSFAHNVGGGRASVKGDNAGGAKGKASDAAKKPTLLQKLLADELQKERTVLLGAIRYILASNFFDVS